MAGHVADSGYHQSYIIIITKHMVIIDTRRMMKLIKAIMMMMVTAKPNARIRKLRHIRKEIGQQGDSCPVVCRE